MSDITFGVVAEGPSDLVILKRFLRKIYESGGRSFLFKDLQPYVDNTSNTGFSEGGWQLVYKWCIAHPPEIRENSLFSTPLFADDMDEFQCDALIVHMDSDICSEIGDKTNVKPVPGENEVPSQHGAFIEATLNEWLWPDGLQDDKRYVLAPAVQSIEAWLVAALSQTDLNPEEDRFIQRRLAELDYEVVRKKPLPKNIKSIKKSISNYERVVTVAEKNVNTIRDRCPHFFYLLKKIDTILGEVPKIV